MSMNLRSILFVSASTATLLAMTPAIAQTTAAQGSPSEVETVVVTGTSLHGVAPAGAEALNMTSEDIVATGATSVDELLATIPQLNSFGSTPYAGQGATQLTINRIDLRSLPQGVSGGSPTLVLLDGHRFVSDGVNQTQPDPGVIPLGMIDHVEVVLDGGSAVYGADAIGGVINFVTKHDFDGFEVSGSHGFGDSYSTNNINVLAGKSWSGGSAYIGYTYAYNTAIDAADRSYEKQLSYATGVGLPFGVQCNPGNVVAGGQNYAITSPTTLTAGNGNICDQSKYGQLFPEEIRHSVMAGFDQDITDSVKFEVKGFYSQRTDNINQNAGGGGALGFTVGEQSTYPGYISTGGGSTAAQSVSGTFAAVEGNYVPTTTRLSTWGITPKLTWKIGDDWVMTAYYNAGSSTTTVNAPQVNNTDLQAATASGAFNPYNPGAASNASAVADALNYNNYGLGVSGLENAKVVFDGPVVSLPGGDLRLAVGSEFIWDSYHGDGGGAQGVFDTYQAADNTTIHPLVFYHRHEKSGFAEANIPIVGPGDAMWFLQSLSFSAAARYDDYSDFGDKLTPSFGFTAKPVDWITLRGKYNKAFQAPSPAQLAQATPQANFYPVSIVNAVQDLINPAFPNPTAGIINIAGTSANLKPQHAQTKDIGFDISPPWVDGLTLHLTYFDIEYGGIIDSPHLGYSTTYFQTYTNDYVMFPSISAATAFLQANHATAASIAQVLSQATAQQGASTYPLYFIANTLQQNLDNSVMSGFDLGFDYARPVWFGTVFASMNGTYLENVQEFIPATLPPPGGVNGINAVGNENSTVGGVGRFNFTATAGTTVGDNFTGQIKWNHVDGYSLTNPIGLGQTSIGQYNTFDLYLQYTLDRDTLSTLSDKLPPIMLSLSVTNLFDKDPPHYYGVGGSVYASPGYGYADQTLGRVVQLGANVKF